MAVFGFGRKSTVDQCLAGFRSLQKIVGKLIGGYRDLKINDVIITSDAMISELNVLAKLEGVLVQEVMAAKAQIGGVSDRDNKMFTNEEQEAIAFATRLKDATNNLKERLFEARIKISAHGKNKHTEMIDPVNIAFSGFDSINDKLDDAVNNVVVIKALLARAKKV